MNATKITPADLRAMKQRGEKIAALTAYDFPTAKLLDECGVPLLLVNCKRRGASAVPSLTQR